MTRLLVSLVKPEAKEFEVSIAGNILRARPASFDEFCNHFLEWRKQGLYHLLCLAARAMPEASLWVPGHLLSGADDWQELLNEFNQSSFCTEHRLTGVCEKLEDRLPALNNHICGILDRIAVLARVKSDERWNPACRTLDDFLSLLHFPSDPSSPYTYSLLNWVDLVDKLEEALPPSLLCPALNPPSRSSWGYKELKLKSDGEVLYIHKGNMAWIEKGSYPPCPIGNAAFADSPTPHRLMEILFRLGEVATSPEIAHLLLYPNSLDDFLRLGGKSSDLARESNKSESKESESKESESKESESKESESKESESDLDSMCENKQDDLAVSNCKDRSKVIELMQQCHVDRIDLFQCINSLTSHLPATHSQSYRRPVRVLLWRLDCPPRAILYKGTADAVDLLCTPAHTLPKLILNDRLRSRTVSGIMLIPHAGEGNTTLDASTALKACLAEDLLRDHFDFSNHPFHQVSVRTTPNTSEDHTTTTLAEALSIFIRSDPQSVTTVNLHESAPWEEEHIDTRYGERQVADNGIRLRDWATVYRSEDELQRCRLAAHEVMLSKVYHSHFPLTTQTEKGEPRQSWVCVASTLPVETRILRHLGGKTPLEVLKRSIENRFMNDNKLLPVRHPDDRIDRSNMEIYTDEAACQVAVVYAPHSVDGDRKSYEMLSFRYAN
jgi:hypothetical protein